MVPRLSMAQPRTSVTPSSSRSRKAPAALLAVSAGPVSTMLISASRASSLSMAPRDQTAWLRIRALP